MKKFALLLVTSALFSCHGGQNRSNEGIENSVDGQENITQDNTSVTNEFIRSFNEIQENLNQIKSKENMVTLNSQTNELEKSQKDQIILDVKYIYELLKKNRASLLLMTKKLTGSENKNEELLKLTDNLTKQVSKQETEIAFLKSRLTYMNIEVNDLDEIISKDQEELAKKNAEINTVYCAIGTHEQLLSQGLILKKGNIFELGNISEINPELRRSMFSYLNMNTTDEISIASKKVNLIGLHPASSYRLEGTKLRIKKLVITDPKAFWGTSKYLVIEVD